MKMNKLVVTPLAAALAMALTSTAAQAKSTIGGIVFTNFYVQNVEDITGNDYTNTQLDVANNSRFRIRWDNEDNVSMYIEMALRDDDNDSLRHAYGKWDIDEKSPAVGRSNVDPVRAAEPQRGHGQQLRPGLRQRISKPSFANPLHLQVHSTVRALWPWLWLIRIKVKKPLSWALYDDQRETVIPRLDIGMAYRTFNWQIFPSLFVHKQDYANAEDLTAYGYSFGAKTGQRSHFTFAAEIGGGKNWGNTKMSLSGSEAGNNAGAIYGATGNLLEDNDNFGYWLDAGWRFSGDETRLCPLRLRFTAIRSGQPARLRQHYGWFEHSNRPALDRPWVPCSS